MKRFLYPLFAVLALISCKKEKMQNAFNGTGSIIQAPNSNGPVGFINNFNSQDSLTAIGLMSSNSLSTDGLAFYFYESYNALNQDNQMALYQIAQARQIKNGLPVFFKDITFGFENGTLNGPSPIPQGLVSAISLNNKPNLSLQQVRNIFVKADNASEAQNISIADSLLVAQLGYYDLNVDYQNKPRNYIKAWYVHARYKGWPQGYIRDDNGSVLDLTPLTHSGPAVP